MPEYAKKEIASALKWTWIVIIITIAYANFAPNYYFMKQNWHLFRANKVTGRIDHTEGEKWEGYP